MFDRNYASSLALSTAILFFFISPVFASIQINATDAGWYNDSGFHTPTNISYFAASTGGFSYRNFFAFDLSGIGSVMNAYLRLYTFQAAGSVNYTLFDVTTNISTLVNGTAGLPAYTDLGSGNTFSNAVAFTTAIDNTFIDIPLNAGAVAAINSSLGSWFAIGGVTTGGTSSIFRFSQLETVAGEWAVQLRVDEVTGVVPECSSFLTFVALSLCVGVYTAVKSQTRVL